MSKLISTNPARGYEAIGSVEISSDDEIKQKVDLSNKAKTGWKELGVSGRINILRRVYENFSSKKEQIASLITREIGKPISQSMNEVEGALEEFKWFLNNGAKALQDEVTFQDKESMHRVVYEPYGTAAVITPWNYPFGMFLWGTIPSLISGNTVIFKISEECPLVGKIIEESMSFLPEGVFSEVYGAGDVGQKIAESDVNIIIFTGSTKVGKLLYGIAAKRFIKAVLEMGGSSPAIVFEDVNVQEIIPQIFSERFNNNGQSCDALKRLIVHESLFDEVVQKLKVEVEKKIVGNPEDEKTNLGSLVSLKQLRLLESQVKDAVEKGARVVAGGKNPKGFNGAFFEPTILTNVTREMRVWNEEVFGPVLPIVPFKTEEEAIMLANDTVYGLGSRVYSSDLKRAERVASRIAAGTVEINSASRWLTCNPFGGYKLSGIGRELGLIGFRELCQVKLISKQEK